LRRFFIAHVDLLGDLLEWVFVCLAHPPPVAGAQLGLVIRDPHGHQLAALHHILLGECLQALDALLTHLGECFSLTLQKYLVSDRIQVLAGGFKLPEELNRLLEAISDLLPHACRVFQVLRCPRSQVVHIQMALLFLTRTVLLLLLI
jgi:hypothetical protein